MQYFKTQHEALKLSKAITLNTEASGKKEVYLDTLSEGATMNLMADTVLLLKGEHTINKYHKIILKDKENETTLIIHFTNPNTKAHVLLGVANNQIINVYKVINMTLDEIADMYIVEVD